MPLHIYHSLLPNPIHWQHDPGFRRLRAANHAVILSHLMPGIAVRANRSIDQRVLTNFKKRTISQPGSCSHYDHSRYINSTSLLLTHFSGTSSMPPEVRRNNPPTHIPPHPLICQSLKQQDGVGRKYSTLQIAMKHLTRHSLNISFPAHLCFYPWEESRITAFASGSSCLKPDQVVLN